MSLDKEIGFLQSLWEISPVLFVCVIFVLTIGVLLKLKVIPQFSYHQSDQEIDLVHKLDDISDDLKALRLEVHSLEVQVVRLDERSKHE